MDGTQSVDRTIHFFQHLYGPLLHIKSEIKQQNPSHGDIVDNVNDHKTVEIMNVRSTNLGVYTRQKKVSKKGKSKYILIESR